MASDGRNSVRIPMLRGLLWAACMLFLITSHADVTSDAVLVEFNRYSNKLAQRDKTPLLRIYSSGRLQVYFPRYMKRAGEYHAQLTQAELSRTLDVLLEADLVGSRASQTQETIAQLQARWAPKSSAFYRSENTITVIDSHFQDTTARLRLINLQSDALRLALPDILRVAAAESLLLNLSEHPGLMRVGPAMPIHAPTSARGD